MNAMEIEERLILAAEMAAFGNHVGPKKLKAMQIPYMHTQADKNGWGHKRGDKRSSDPRANACRLKPEDEELLAAYKRDFWSGKITNPTARQISEADEAWGWLPLVQNANHRAALSIWATCQASPKKRLKDWYTEQGISRQTGLRWKNAAVLAILSNLVRKPLQHNEMADFGVLHEDPENGHIRVTVENGAAKSAKPVSWKDDPAFQPLLRSYAKGYGTRLEVDDREFNWAAKRNEMRRQRQARRQHDATV